jgi:hypothetical protein
MSQPVDDSAERQKLAANLTIASVSGITLISLAAIYFSKDIGASAEHVMTAVLPLFGSWIATVLAYYFARENLRAATSSVSTLVASQRDDARLSNVPVKDKMIERTRIVTLSDRFKPIGDAALKDVTTYLNERAVRRAPVFDDNGTVTHMVHLSMIDQFIREQVTAGKALGALKFSDLLGVPALKHVLEKSFEVVAEQASLADAKAKMDANPICEDVFVTKSGVANEPVIGWITDNAILEAGR